MGCADGLSLSSVLMKVRRLGFSRLVAPFLYCAILVTPSHGGGRFCTALRAKERNETKKIVTPCKETYEARCGFFTFRRCTYYKKSQCISYLNRTYTFYYAVTECCPGWVQAENNSCVYVGQNLDKSSHYQIPVGAYAGIGAAGLFMFAVIYFTIIAILKRNRREKKKKEDIHIEQLESLNKARI